MPNQQRKLSKRAKRAPGSGLNSGLPPGAFPLPKTVPQGAWVKASSADAPAFVERSPETNLGGIQSACCDAWGSLRC